MGEPGLADFSSVSSSDCFGRDPMRINCAGFFDWMRFVSYKYQCQTLKETHCTDLRPDIYYVCLFVKHQVFCGKEAVK